jgi:hypothetical protein
MPSSRCKHLEDKNTSLHVLINVSLSYLTTIINRHSFSPWFEEKLQSTRPVKNCASQYTNAAESKLIPESIILSSINMKVSHRIQLRLRPLAEIIDSVTNEDFYKDLKVIL